MNNLANASTMQNPTPPLYQPNLLDRILEFRSPISYSFISYLSLRDIINLLSLSKSFRQALLDLDRYGYIFKNLSLNHLSAPFYGLPAGPFPIPWGNEITRRFEKGNLHYGNLSQFVTLLHPVWHVVTRLNLDACTLTPNPLKFIAQLGELVELSLRHCVGLDITELYHRYGRQDHPNPKLAKLSFWNLDQSLVWYSYFKKRLDRTLRLGELYEIDVARLKLARGRYGSAAVAGSGGRMCAGWRLFGAFAKPARSFGVGIVRGKTGRRL
ncbi:hypothetical protein ABW19_dt0208968 [Dactylella cylindrospora]|nr:hypothetical protein ABW19_dt0208968 [Dactylella cylindrospora]